jgi:hypothetical protein
MKTDQIIMCFVALFLGMLLANMLTNVCGCNIVEGQWHGTGLAPAVKKSGEGPCSGDFTHAELLKCEEVAKQTPGVWDPLSESQIKATLVLLLAQDESDDRAAGGHGKGGHFALDDDGNLIDTRTDSCGLARAGKDRHKCYLDACMAGDCVSCKTGKIAKNQVPRHCGGTLITGKTKPRLLAKDHIKATNRKYQSCHSIPRYKDACEDISLWGDAITTPQEGQGFAGWCKWDAKSNKCNQADVGMYAAASGGSRWVGR